MLLRPEWLGRIDRCFSIKQNKKYVQIITEHIYKVFEKANKYEKINRIIVTSSLNSKNLQYQILLKTISNNQTISRWLHAWFYKQDFMRESTTVWHFTEHIKYRNKLYEFLEILYYIGLEWHIYTNLKDPYLYLNLYLVNQTQQILFLSNARLTGFIVKQIGAFMSRRLINLRCARCSIYRYYHNYINLIDVEVKSEQNSNYIIKPNIKSIQYIFNILRRILYHKNTKGYWKMSNYIKINKSIFLINYLLKLWHIDYSNIVDNSDIYKINYNIDNWLYFWQAKK